MTLSRSPEYVRDQERASAIQFASMAIAARATGNEAQALDYEAAAQIAGDKAQQLTDELEMA